MILTQILKNGHVLIDRKILIAILLLLPIHLILAKLSSTFAFSDGTSAIWLSSGLFLSIFLRFGRRFWFAVWLCDFLVLQILFYSNPLVSASIAVVDVSDSLVCSFLITRFIRGYPFDRALDAIKFVVLLFPYPILGAVMGVFIQCLDGFSSWKDFGILWRGWFTGSIVSLLVITPVLLAQFQHIQSQRAQSQRAQSQQESSRTSPTLSSRTVSNRQYCTEFVLVSVTILSIGYVAFWRNIPVEYMIILPLLWAAFRFNQRESTLLILIATVIAATGTAQGHGSFAQNSIGRSIMLLQSFMSALTIATLLLAAAVQETRISAAQLQQANDELEDRVNARTAELTKTLQQLQTTQSQLIQQEKMSSLGQLVAGVAHEINNPINFIHGNLSYIQTYTQDLLSFVRLHQTHYPNPVPEIQAKVEEIDLPFLQDDLAKILGSMKIGTDRIRQIVLSLRTFSRMDEAEFKPVDIHEGIDSTLLILQHRLKAKSDRPEIEIIKHYAPLPPIECYAGQLNQVFMNILVNAIDALDEKQVKQTNEHHCGTSDRITISTSRISSDWIQIAIADTGSGMTEATRQRLFNPFFTTKPIGKGTGMGMSISYQIITEKHGGELTCHSTLGKGTEFIIRIPIRQS